MHHCTYIRTYISSYFVHTQIFIHASPGSLVLILLWKYIFFPFNVLYHPYFSDISTSVKWIGTKCATDVHGSQRMTHNDFCDSLTFLPAPPWDWHLWLWITCPQLLDGLPWNLAHSLMSHSGSSSQDDNCNRFGDLFHSTIIRSKM